MSNIFNPNIKRLECYKEFEKKLFAAPYESLVALAERSNLQNIKNAQRADIVGAVIQVVEEGVRKKPKVKNENDLINIVKGIVDGYLATLAEMSGKEKQGSDEEDDMDNLQERLKLKNMRTSCFCGLKGGKKEGGLVITCTNHDCGAKFHHECLPWRLSDLPNFECPSCLILNNDPLNDVIQILYEPSILLTEEDYEFKMSLDQYSKMTEDVNIGVEIRTIKLDGEHFFEQTWPDKCVIRINNKIIKEVKPLHQNSSLKKRRDEKLFNRQNIRLGLNSMSIVFQNVQDGKNTKLKQDPRYVFIIVLVRKLSFEELSNRIRSINKLSVEKSKEFIKEKFLVNKDLEINEIKVNLIDNISFTHIKYPARGLYCDHVPCFSLDFFIKSMENNYTRKWSCPICKKRCQKLVIDTYLESIIDQAKKKNPDLENVFFLKNGDVVFKSDIIEEQEKEDEGEPAQSNDNRDVDLKKDKMKIAADITDASMEILSITSDERSARKKSVKKKIIETISRTENNSTEKSQKMTSELINKDGRLDEYSPRTLIYSPEVHNQIEKEVTSTLLSPKRTPKLQVPVITEPENLRRSKSPELPIISEDDDASSVSSYGEKRAVERSKLIEKEKAREKERLMEREREAEEEREKRFEKLGLREKLAALEKERLREKLGQEDENAKGESSKDKAKSNYEMSNSFEPFKNIQRREEPVIDLIVNQKMEKDEEYIQDKVYLTRMWRFLQSTKKVMSGFEFANSWEYLQNAPRKLEKDLLLQKVVGMMEGYCKSREDRLMGSNKLVMKRYKGLMDQVKEIDCYYDEVEVENKGVMLVKRNPRDSAKDTELMNDLMSGYNMFDDKTPRLAWLRKIQPEQTEFNKKKPQSTVDMV